MCMDSANERRRYIVTSSLIGQAHTQNDPCIPIVWLFITLRSRQNGRHFADNIFKLLFLIKNGSVLIKISLNLSPKFQLIGQHWFRLWLGTKQVPSHDLNH